MDDAVDDRFTDDDTTDDAATDDLYVGMSPISPATYVSLSHMNYFDFLSRSL